MINSNYDKKFLILLWLYVICLNCSYGNNKHTYSEKTYQHAWCSAHKGIEEFKNSDKTRVDCLTKTHAIEFDYASVSRSETSGLR